MGKWYFISARAESVSERFIASRLSFKSRIARNATALSAFVIVIAVSVLGGFKAQIHKNISRMYSDISLSPGDISAIENDERIAYICPSISETALIKLNVASSSESTDKFQGVIFKSDSQIEDKTACVISEYLSNELGVFEGDTLTAYFMGKRVKARKFRISKVDKEIALIDKDAPVAFLSLGALQRIKGYKADEYNFTEIHLKPKYQNREDILSICSEFAYRTYLTAQSSVSKLPAMYDWLEVLNGNVVLVLILMCLVAAFNTISGFLILIMRSTKTIGLLKTMGMNSSLISRTFLRIISKSTIQGLIIGNISALILVIVQDITKLIKLNPENYFIGYVPMHIDIPSILLANLLAFTCIMLCSLWPAKRIEKIDPAQSTKGETL